MAPGARDRMVASAGSLLARRGLQATSVAEVLEHSGAPRGSVYHHFPEGKEQLIGEALDAAGDNARMLLERKAGQPADEIVGWFVHIWREVLRRSQFEAGCAVLAVTVAADTPGLLERAAAVFRAWRTHLAGLLETGGLTHDDAVRFATILVASTEGAVVLCRADQNFEALDVVETQLLDEVRARMLRAAAG